MEKSTLVIKYGSEAVTNEHGMAIDKVQAYALDAYEASANHELVIVSSGSVAVGECLWRQMDHADDTVEPSLQAYAMMGSGESFSTWQRALSNHNIAAGQLLVTHKEIDDPSEKPVLLDALRSCRDSGIIPIVNENDALSVVELAKKAYGGDNDGIGLHIATVVHASELILFTNNGGLLNDQGEEIRNLGKQDHKAALRMIKNREQVNAVDGNRKGRGGMTSKLSIGIEAAHLGIRSYIAKAGSPIEEVLAGNTGTHIVANTA
jgi:glutamate 5-kinase